MHNKMLKTLFNAMSCYQRAILYSERGKLVHHGIGVLVYGGLVHSIILSFYHSKMNGPIYPVLSIVELVITYYRDFIIK